MNICGRHFLENFFYPGSVAIVGASRNPNTVDFHLLGNLVKLDLPVEYIRSTRTLKKSWG